MAASDMTDHLEQFEREYLDYHQISLGRRQQQRVVLRALSAHAEKSLIECGPSEIKAYLSGELARGLHPNTVQKQLRMLTPYFQWAWETKLISADDLMGIRAIKAPRGARPGLPRPYSRKEILQLWADLETKYPNCEQKFWDRWRRGTSRFKRVRSEAMQIQIRAIISLALYCGLRRNEIYRATIDDIHYDNQYVVVRHGKDGRNREVPHTAASREAVKAWIELRTELKPPHDKTWLSLARADFDLNPLNEDRMKMLLSTVGPWKLHRLRHTAGTEWLRATKRVEIVQRLLGHASLQQTLGYAEIVRDDLHEAVAKAEEKFMEAIA
jgi:integrase